MAVELHKLQPQPHPEAWKCGWCHGSGYGGEKTPVCGSCKGKGWILPERLREDPALNAPAEKEEPAQGAFI